MTSSRPACSARASTPTTSRRTASSGSAGTRSWRCGWPRWPRSDWACTCRSARCSATRRSRACSPRPGRRLRSSRRPRPTTHPPGPSAACGSTSGSPEGRRTTSCSSVSSRRDGWTHRRWCGRWRRPRPATRDCGRSSGSGTARSSVRCWPRRPRRSRPSTTTGPRTASTSTPARAAAEFGRAPFDVSAAPALRFLLVSHPGGRQALVLAAHHMMLDGRAVGLLLREVFARYDELHRGGPDPAPGPGVPMRALLRHEDAVRASGVWDRQAELWSRHLAGVPTVLELPSDRQQPRRPDPAGARSTVDLGRSVSVAVADRARSLGITPFAVPARRFRADAQPADRGAQPARRCPGGRPRHVRAGRTHRVRGEPGAGPHRRRRRPDRGGLPPRRAPLGGGQPGRRAVAVRGAGRPARGRAAGRRPPAGAGLVRHARPVGA